MTVRLFILTSCALLVLGSPATARTWHVPAEAPTIAAGLDSAIVGDVVEIACGTYHEHGVALKAGVTLRSQTGEPDCVTIDADSLDSVLVSEFLEERAVVEGLTLTGGFAQGQYPSGGGLLSLRSSLLVRRCRFADNVAGWGGGLHAWNSRIDVEDCVFTGNSAHVGAAAIDCTGGTPAFARCEITGNHSVATSSALRIAHAAAAFTDCRFADNDLPAGGVVFVGVDSRLSLTRCTLAGQAQGGVHGLFVQNVRVAGSANVFTGLGGAAIRAEYNATVTLDHATIAANGDGLVLGENSEATLHACLVAFNDGTGISVTAAFAEVTCCDVFGNGGGDYAGEMADQTGLAGNISADPLFCDLAGGDLALAVGSPALPAGNLCYVQMGAFGVGCGETAVPSLLLPSATLLPARPNPFNPRTTLTFTLPLAAPARLEIFALDGARIATLLDEALAAGSHAVTWDGRDHRGHDAPAGIYLGRLAAAGTVSVQRLALVR